MKEKNVCCNDFDKKNKIVKKKNFEKNNSNIFEKLLKQFNEKFKVNINFEHEKFDDYSYEEDLSEDDRARMKRDRLSQALFYIPPAYPNEHKINDARYFFEHFKKALCKNTKNMLSLYQNEIFQINPNRETFLSKSQQNDLSKFIKKLNRANI